MNKSLVFVRRRGLSFKHSFPIPQTSKKIIFPAKRMWVIVDVRGCPGPAKWQQPLSVAGQDNCLRRYLKLNFSRDNKNYSAQWPSAESNLLRHGFRSNRSAPSKGLMMEISTSKLLYTLLYFLGDERLSDYYRKSYSTLLIRRRANKRQEHCTKVQNNSLFRLFLPWVC